MKPGETRQSDSFCAEKGAVEAHYALDNRSMCCIARVPSEAVTG
jgi:hypothetical protein